MIYKYCNNRVLDEVKEAYPDIIEDVIDDVIEFQGENAESVIKQGAFESIKFCYLGKLTVNHKRVQKMSELKLSK
jgi:hypothetical protein